MNAQQCLAMRTLLLEAVDGWPDFDNPDEYVSGADLVEWFEQFRFRAKQLLAAETNVAT